MGKKNGISHVATKITETVKSHNAFHLLNLSDEDPDNQENQNEKINDSYDNNQKTMDIAKRESENNRKNSSYDDHHSNDWQSNDRRPNDRRPNDRRPNDRRPNDRRSDDYQPNDRRSDDYQPNDRRSDDRRSDDYQPNDRRSDDRRSDDITQDDKISEDGFKSYANKKKSNRELYKPRFNEENGMNKKMEKVEDISNYPVLAYYNDESELPGDSMKLNSKWTIWIHDNEDTDWSVGSYKAIYQIDSIGKMWRFLNVFENLNKTMHQYYIMREGITPIWEDNNNKDGGICSIMMENSNRSSKNFSGDICVDTFISILCLVMNETFVVNNMDINGLCYSVKQKNALIKLWVKNYSTNKNFIDKLPISLLHTVSNILDNGQRPSKFNRSKISIQIKQIVPLY